MPAQLVVVAAFATPIVAQAQTSPDKETTAEAAQPVITALHQQGDARFEQQDYAGARGAWLDAYQRVPPTVANSAYRVSLLALIVQAAEAEFDVSGERRVLIEASVLVRQALAWEMLDREMRAILSQEVRRLDHLLAHATPPAARLAHVDLSTGIVVPTGVDATVPTLATGSVLTAAGVAALAAGAVFGPRARREVRDAGDSEAQGQPFVDDELRKGRAWMIAGGTAIAAGAAMIATGLVLRRKRGTKFRSLAANGASTGFTMRVRLAF